jgi:hypothetical protein
LYVVAALYGVCGSETLKELGFRGWSFAPPADSGMAAAGSVSRNRRRFRYMDFGVTSDQRSRIVLLPTPKG